MKCIDHFFTGTTKGASRRECITLIFSLLVSISDSKNFIPTLIRFDFPSKLVEWLNMINKRNISSDPLDSVMVTMCNVSQCEEGVIALNKVDAIAALEISEKVSANRLAKNLFISSFYFRIYAMIATAEKLKTLTILKTAIDFLLSKIVEASASTDLRTRTGHLYEYLVPLAKLFVNDNVATYVLNDSKLNGLEFFIELFYKHNLLSDNDLFVKHLIRLALYNILCSLAFYPAVREKLKENEIFIKTVLEASKSSTSNNETFIPSLLRNNLMTIKAAADGILVYLDKFQIPTTNEDKELNKKVPMISYSHKDVNFCRSVVGALKEKDIPVWVDEDGHCLSSDCWEEIAIAIKNASTVLIVVSDNYCTKSHACRVEASYAVKLRIPIIALYIDDTYQAESWLDIHLGGLYVKFGSKPFAERIDRLVKYILASNNSLKSIETSQTQISHSSHEVYVPSVVKKNNNLLNMNIPQAMTKYSVPKMAPHIWSKVEVRACWCTERTLVPQLCTFCDGEALCVYARIFLILYKQNPLQHLESLREQLKHEHDINFYDNHYANIVSSMIWIVKQDKNEDRLGDNDAK